MNNNFDVYSIVYSVIPCIQTDEYYCAWLRLPGVSAQGSLISYMFKTNYVTVSRSIPQLYYSRLMFVSIVVVTYAISVLVMFEGLSQGNSLFLSISMIRL